MLTCSKQSYCHYPYFTVWMITITAHVIAVVAACMVTVVPACIIAIAAACMIAVFAACVIAIFVACVIAAAYIIYCCIYECCMSGYECMTVPGDTLSCPL